MHWTDAQSEEAVMDGATSQFRRPPPGFEPSQWQTFEQRGILVVENAYGDHELAVWTQAVLRAQASAGATADGFFTLRNFVEADPAFASLIDHPAHLGLVYDLYGEMLKLQLSELFVRAPGSGARPERWHIDGPRTLPYAVFAPGAPMQVKVGIWLTDVLHRGGGNLAFVPGSHRQQYFAAYDTDEEVQEE